MELPDGDQQGVVLLRGFIVQMNLARRVGCSTGTFFPVTSTKIPSAAWPGDSLPKPTLSPKCGSRKEAGFGARQNFIKGLSSAVTH